jgi:hypothetical protein
MDVVKSTNLTVWRDLGDDPAWVVDNVKDVIFRDLSMPYP